MSVISKRIPLYFEEMCKSSEKSFGANFVVFITDY